MGSRPRHMLLAAAGALALVLAGVAPAAADAVILHNGGFLGGQIEDAELILRTPHADYPVSRVSAWRILFNNAGLADSVELRNGNRLSGILSRTQFTLRLPGGGTRVLGRGELAMITFAAPAPGAGRVLDVLILQNADHVAGQLEEAALDVVVPSGVQKISRERVRNVLLDSVNGDTVDLVDGGRLSGVVQQGYYTVRTPDGQTLRFSRGQIKELVLGGAAGAGAGPVGAGGPAAAQPGAGAPGVAGTGPGTGAPGAMGAPGTPGAGAPGAGAPGTGPAGPGTPGAPGAGPGAGAPGAGGAAGAPAPGTTPGPAPGAGAVAPGAVPAPLRTVLRDVHFAFDRADLGPEAQQTLDGIADALKGVPRLRLLVEGHADERGTPEYNLALGQRRADAAKAYLVGRGIDASRIDTISYGEQRPLDPARGEAAWALNRRAHFVVVDR